MSASSVTVRQATPEDALGIARVHVASWQAAYCDLLAAEFLASINVIQRQDNWERRLSLNAARTWVAEQEKSEQKKIVGFIDTGSCRDTDQDASVGELTAIYSLAEVWGQGVGYQLWQAAHTSLAAQYRSLILWVLVGNARAIAFYERLGFEPDGHSKTEDWAGYKIFERRYQRKLEPF